MPRTGLKMSAALLLSAAMVTPMTASAAPPAGTAVKENGLSATIRHTEFGIPHIVADDYAGLGYGTGYAAAKDNVCLIADGVVTLRGDRSRHFGPDASTDGSLSSASTNLDSDVFFRSINRSRVVEKLVRKRAPYGPAEEIRELVRGWTAGYNRYLREGDITDPSCAGKEWLRPISEIDVWRRGYALAMLGGHGLLTDQITTAEPPADGAAEPERLSRAEAAKSARKLKNLMGQSGMGSNAIALGSDATATGEGLLLGNPHYPWHGGRRFWQMHQTIPGELDVSGAGLIGGVGVSIGYNSTFAWSHTVATGVPFTVTELKLVPGDPTSYLVDGQPEEMTKRRITVKVKQPDGKVKPVKRDQWSTRYGPIVTSVPGLPLPWTEQTAYAITDPNTRNMRIMNTSLALGKARTTDEAVAALKDTQGLPWVNTIGADSRGKAVHAQVQVLPNVTDEFAARCNTPLGSVVFGVSGLAILDGTRADCAPGKASGALQSGILDPDRYPVQTRADYVTNSNDSHWLSNPAAPQTGYDRIIGDEQTQRSLRTRSGLVNVQEQLAESAFSRADLQELVFANRSHAAELAADDVGQMCRELDLGQACDVLANWDTRFDTDSRGALLFDRFWRRAGGAADLWRTPFDASDPVNTPRGFNTDSPTARQALVDAVDELTSSGIPLDAALGDYQAVTRNGERIPVSGGLGGHGILNMIVGSWEPGAGYTEVVHGSSYVQVVSFDGDDCPDARTLLTYSQSTDPTSPHYADQTRLFSEKAWVEGRYCAGDIESDPNLEEIVLRARR